jgi:UDP-N-acetylglucosamine 1-carboxyvinyltransferase
MAKFVISGEHSVNGEITVAGNKNAALPIIAATVLTDDECIIENLPVISDVQKMLEILKHLGKKVECQKSHIYKISGRINNNKIDAKMASCLRASVLYLSVLLAKAGEVKLAPPGGCVIGRRNIDQHLGVMKDLGAEIKTGEHGYSGSLEKPGPARMFLQETSVTATENAMLLASAIPGVSVIDNAACEPHVLDLADVLNKMGATITGGGTNRVQVKGTDKLRGFNHRIVPDHIEAGTFAIAAACTKGDLVIYDAYREHLQMTQYYLENLGVNLQFIDNKTVHIKPGELISKIRKIQAGLWPAFPTDLMSPMIVLATQVKGTILCHDWLYESRMFFVDKLIVMGAQITQCDPHRVIITGPTNLRGQELSSPDIRAGVALVIAALTAKGTSVIDRAELIDRGYEDIAKRLTDLGVKIKRDNP